MKLSVIIPVFNAAPYLRECLSSVCLPGVEVIAVDDGSTDGSGAILDGWSGIVIIHQDNAGAGAARNAGIEAAHGEWLLFLDADDLLATGWQCVVLEMIARHSDADMVGFARSDQLPLAPCLTSAIVRSLDVRETVGLEHLVDGMWQYAYRRSLIGNVRFRCVVRVEDKIFQSEMMARAGCVVRSEAVIYGYRQHEGSIMHQNWSEKSFESELRFRILWIENILRAGKRLDASSLRLIGLNYLEYHPHIIRQVQDGVLRERMYELWFDVLAEASRLPFGTYQRFVLRVLAKTRSRLLVACLCQLPFALKQKMRRRK